MEQHAGLAYACFFLLGSGILAPWNAFITAADYFEAVFPGRHMDRLFTVAYLPVCLLMLGLLIKFNSMPGRPRILFSFAGFVLIMLAIPLIDLVLVGREGTGPNSALAVVLLAVVLVGVLDGLAQGAIFADAAALPPQYTHAVVGGTASSGVIICLLRIATKAALPPTRAGLRKSTAIYFSISGGITLACFAVYYAVLPRLGVVRYYKRGPAAGAVVELSPQPSIGEAAGVPAESVVVGPAEERPLVKRATPAVKGTGPLSWQHVVAEAWHSALAMVITYVITLSIFPGVLSEDIQSADLGSWYPILLITAFNVSDLVGKNIPFCGMAPSPRTLLAASLLRVLFVPAFLLAGRYAGGVAGLMALLTVSLGFSNGLLTALLMTLAPASVECGEEGLVESIMVFSLVLGLTLGALAGWLWLL
ncbi:hypothetical protein OEZ86_000502 [Tetradesmus obliquus]|nr:hypothetical protein OEZ86_000502 [Tetradesmus obliquus]